MATLRNLIPKVVEGCRRAAARAVPVAWPRTRFPWTLVSRTKQFMFRAPGRMLYVSCQNLTPGSRQHGTGRDTKDSKLVGGHEDIRTLISQNLTSIPVNCILYQAAPFSTFVDQLLRARFTVSEITTMFIQTPALLEQDLEDLKAAIEFFNQQGFLPAQVCSMLCEQPTLVKVDLNEATHVVEFLRGLGFKDRQLQRAVTLFPEVLAQSTLRLHDGLDRLLKIFTRSSVERMLRSSLSLLLDDPDVLQEKLEYIFYEMGLKDDAMVQANAPQYSLRHIQQRHLVLERLGVYEKPDRRGLTRRINPDLRTILEGSDRQFVRRVAGITLEEFHVFGKLLDVELETRDSSRHGSDGYHYFRDEDSPDNESWDTGELKPVTMDTGYRKIYHKPKRW